MFNMREEIHGMKNDPQMRHLLKVLKGTPNGTSGRRCGLTLPMFIKLHGCSIGKSVGLSTVNLHFIEQMSPHFEWINFRFLLLALPTFCLATPPVFQKLPISKWLPTQHFFTQKSLRRLAVAGRRGHRRAELHFRMLSSRLSRAWHP